MSLPLRGNNVVPPCIAVSVGAKLLVESLHFGIVASSVHYLLIEETDC